MPSRRKSYTSKKRRATKKTKTHKRRPLTAYNKFVKKHMKSSSIARLSPQKKMKKIAQMWRSGKR